MMAVAIMSAATTAQPVARAPIQSALIDRLRADLAPVMGRP